MDGAAPPDRIPIIMIDSSASKIHFQAITDRFRVRNSDASPNATGQTERSVRVVVASSSSSFVAC